MSLLFLFVLLLLLLLLLCVCVFFLRDSNMISIVTVEFIYYLVITIPVKLGKP